MKPVTLDLQAALEPALGRIARLERRPCPYASSSTIEELDVTLASGAAVPVVFKDLGAEAMLPDARRVKPAFLFDPWREIEVYRGPLAARALGTAACYGTVTDAATGRYWLFLEHVAGPLLWQVGDFARWEQAARWLAGLHAGGVPPATHLLRYDAAYYRHWLDRAVAFTASDSLGPGYARAVDRLLRLPVTFIHGEFYASNVLVQAERICPVDWEMAALGPGLMDLAALTAGRWTADQRRRLAAAYCGGEPTADFLQALDCCRLHLAVRWLGWSKHWRPPPEHAQDWRREAAELADRLTEAP